MPVHRNGAARSHGRPAFNLTIILLNIAPFYIPASSAGRLQFIVNIFIITLEFVFTMDPTERMVVSLRVTATLLMIKDTQHFPTLSGPLLAPQKEASPGLPAISLDC